MIKSVLTSSYDFGEQAARIIGVTGKGLDVSHLRKSAASSVGLFKDIDVKPENDKSVLHIVAMGSNPFYPANKNGDAFYDTNRVIEIKTGKSIPLGKGLIDTHKTFETHAKVFKEHFNSEDDKVYGSVLKSRYNKDLNRVELLISVPNAEWEDELRSMELGKPPAFSMSCRLPADVCSYCGHRAKNRSEYCGCLKHHLGQITSDGHLVSAVNDDVTFFDISGVRNPADRIALGLLKAASATHTIGGAELAEILHIPTETISYRSKFASVLKKLAELEKSFEAQASAVAPNAAAKIPSVSDQVMQVLKSSSLSSEQILGTLAGVKVALSLPDFVRVLTGPQFDELMPFIKGAEARLPGVFGRICVAPKVQDGVIELPSTPMPTSISRVLGPVKRANGMDAESIRQRVTTSVISGDPNQVLKSASFVSDNSTEELLAQLYGQYKAAFCYKHLDDKGLTFYSVLSHYINRE